MKNFKQSRLTVTIGLLGLLFIAAFQNFTPTQKAEYEAAKNKLENHYLAGLYDYCAVAGTAADKRPASRQFKCNELPFGKIIGMNPWTHERFMAENPQISTPPGQQYLCWGRSFWENQQLCTAVRNSTNARRQADQDLELWHTKKEIINHDISFRDKAGKSRSVKLSAYVNRSLIETSTHVVVGNNEIGEKNYGQQRIFKPQGHHFFNVNKDNYTMSTCTFFPGMRISGDTMGSKYSIFDEWWGSYSIHFSINPGHFKFDRFETCNLLKLNKGGNQDNLVQLIGLKAPKFIGAQISGLAFDIDIGFFGWFVTVILAAILNFIPIIGTFLSAALISAVLIVTETNVPASIAQTYLNRGLESYDTSESWNKLLSNFDTSEANIKSGGYLKDIATISMLKNTVIPAFKEQIAAHNKIEYLRSINPSAVAALEKAESDLREAKLTSERIEQELKAQRDSIEAKLRLEREQLEAKLRAERARFKNNRFMATER